MRPARALIDLEALRSNYRLARELGGGRALAVVKADAYGHGAVACAQALEPEADGFAVACIEEALELRAAGIKAPIVLLEGVFEPAELELVVRHDLWLAVASLPQLEWLEACHVAGRVQVWLWLDSGMHRLGFDEAGFRDAYARLSALPRVAAIVLATHMARADELDSTRTHEQFAVFRRATRGLVGATSICNSPSVLGWPGVQSDWARPGLMLYGGNPLHPRHNEHSARLRPVMTVEARVIAVRMLGVGEPVGYGGKFVADRPTRVGVVALGYADGYPQFAPNGTPVLIDGAPGQLIGRVSMDMLTVDLTGHSASGLGSIVQLWGSAPTTAELAARCHTSAYHLTCGVKRIPREYLNR